jgi:hypothetical protein
VSDTEGPTDGEESSAGPGPEAVGSVGEEAAKLLGALSEWARDQGTDYAGTAAGAASSFAHAVRDVNEHIATDSAECRYCPVCQVIHVVRSTSPEVREHLSLAASSLMNAAAGLLATHTSGPSTAPVEKIDLDDGDGDWDEEP